MVPDIPKSDNLISNASNFLCISGARGQEGQRGQEDPVSEHLTQTEEKHMQNQEKNISGDTQGWTHVSRLTLRWPRRG